MFSKRNQKLSKYIKWIYFLSLFTVSKLIDVSNLPLKVYLLIHTYNAKNGTSFKLCCPWKTRYLIKISYDGITRSEGGRLRPRRVYKQPPLFIRHNARTAPHDTASPLDYTYYRSVNDARFIHEKTFISYKNIIFHLNIFLIYKPFLSLKH